MPVLEPIEYLVQEYGFEVTIIQIRSIKRFDLKISELHRPDTILVSAM